MIKDGVPNPNRQTMLVNFGANSSSVSLDTAQSPDKDIKAMHRRSLIGGKISDHFKSASEPARRVSVSKNSDYNAIPGANNSRARLDLISNDETPSSPAENRKSFRKAASAKKISVPPPPPPKMPTPSTPVDNTNSPNTPLHADASAPETPESTSRPQSIIGKHKSLTNLSADKGLDMKHMSLSSLAEAYQLTSQPQSSRLSRPGSTSLNSLSGGSRRTGTASLFGLSQSELSLMAGTQFEEDETQLQALKSSLEAEATRSTFTKLGIDIDLLLRSITTLENSVSLFSVRAAKAENDLRKIKNEKSNLEKELQSFKG